MAFEQKVGRLAKGIHQKKVTPGRRCEECTLCCSLMRVEGKPVGEKRSFERCRFQTRHGCGVYSQRPTACSGFRCIWLEGFLPDEMRPDRVGLVVTIERLAGGPIWCVYEKSNGITGSSTQARLLASGLLSTQLMPVAIIHARIAAPDGTEYKPTKLVNLDGETYHLFFSEERGESGFWFLATTNEVPGWVLRLVKPKDEGER